jgi:GT2 family glycosyltransferase
MSAHTDVVQVVIVTFNRAEYLRKCLAALVAQTYPISQITVVNNCSTDHTTQVLDEVAATGVPVTQHSTKSNLGGAGGFALAFELAKKQNSDWVWVMDDDVEPEPNCLAQLLAASEGYAVVQPNRYNDDDDFLEIYRKVNITNPLSSMFQLPCRLRRADRDLNEDIGFFPFEGPLIRKSMLDSLDLPRAEYFLFCDDVEYSVRVSKAGGRIRLCGAALMRRMIHPVADINFNWRNYFDFRNRIWLDQTHGGLIFSWVRGTLWLLWQWFTCMRRGRDRMSYYIVWSGTVDGLMGRKKTLEDVIGQFAR